LTTAAQNADSVLEKPRTMNQNTMDQYIALRDEQAHYRGKWLICADSTGQYWALHDTASEADRSSVVEQRCFKERLEASRFMRHLLLHGWSVYVQSGHKLIDQLW
jgi:hypothetical protein